MEVAGATQIGVFHDGGGFGGMSGGLVGGEERGNGLAGQAADLDGACRSDLGPLAADVTIKAQDAEACSEALLGMRPAGEDGDDQPLGLQTDGRAPAPETIRRPLGIAAVRARHVRGVCSIARHAIAELVDSNAFAAMEDLDHPRGRPDVDLLADEGVRDGVEEAPELDMIIGRSSCKAPFGELVLLSRQAGERGAFDGVEEVFAADAEATHDVGIDAFQHLGDGSVCFGKREERLFAQATEDAALGETHAVLNLRLVLRTPRPGWQDANAIVGCHHTVAAVDLRIVEAGVADARLQIVGHDQAGHAAEEGKHPHM